jgi:hypothetical protein
MLPAIALPGLLLLGSLPTLVAAAVPGAKPPSRPAPSLIQVVSVHGEALAGDRQLQAGNTLAAGTELRTGANGHVRFSLADGSTLTLEASGRLVIDRYRVLPVAQGVDSSLRLERGRVEAGIRPPLRSHSRFEIRTPVAIATTRGALFRITADPARRSATFEAIEGSVLVADSANTGTVDVAAGLGSRVVAGAPPTRPSPLLAGPHLWTGIQLVEQRRVDIPFSPLAGAVMYRVIITPGDDLARHVVEEIAPASRVRIAALADGDYFVRVRAIDQIALEGSETIARMKIRVLADPPELAQPADRSRLYGNSAQLAWQPDAAAIGYVVQLADDGTFRNRQREWNDLREPNIAVVGLRPGSYYWRVASVFKDGSQSRLSAARMFRLEPVPAPPAPPTIDGGVLRFTWAGNPGQNFTLQLAADPRFEYIVEVRHTNRPAADVPRPLPGSYFARLRNTDPDGSVGPFCDAIKIEIPGNAPATACLVAGERGVCAVYAPAASAPPR